MMTQTQNKIFKTRAFYFAIIISFLLIVGTLIYLLILKKQKKQNKQTTNKLFLSNIFTQTINPVERRNTTTSSYLTTTISPYTWTYMNPSFMECCYSMRLVVPTYTGPVIRVEMDDGTLHDFYTDSTQSYMTTGPNNTGTPMSTLVGANIGSGQVRIWYDQSGSENHAVSDTTDCPFIEKDLISSFSNKYVLGFTYVSGKTYLLTLQKAIKPYSIFSQFYWNKSAIGSYGTILSSSTKIGFGVRFYNKTLNSEQNEYDWFYQSSGDKYFLLNGSLTNETLELKKLTTLCLSVETPVNSTIDIIGTDTSSSARSISGYITEMIFYNKPLTTNEMEEYYKNKFDLGV